MLAGSRDRIIYPFDTPQARYSAHDIPSILCVALPHLTPDYERLFEELGPVVRGRPKATLPEQYLFMFEWLCKRLGRRVWVERSGGSLLFGRRLMGLFPQARVVHIHRDGRDTALSMSQHPAFKAGPALMRRLQRMGVDPVRRRPDSQYQPLHPAEVSLRQHAKDDAPGCRPGGLRRVVEPHDPVEPGLSVVALPSGADCCRCATKMCCRTRAKSCAS